MPLTKTETMLLDRLKEAKDNNWASASVYGKREVQAATKLHDKNLVTFVDQCMTVDKAGVCVHSRDIELPDWYVYQGYLEV